MNNNNSFKSNYYSFFITLFISLTGCILANYLTLPIPFLLGPLLIILIVGRWGRIQLFWPPILRNIGIIIVGYTIGLSFTKSTILLIVHQLPSIFFMTICLILICVISAYYISRFSNVDFPTILIGSIPGGLTQMVLLAEEIKGINVSVVTLLQVTRLMIIIFCVPILIFIPFFHNDEIPLQLLANRTEAVDLFPNIIYFVIMSIVGVIVCSKFKLPTPYLVGPIFFTALLKIVGNLEGPLLPSFIIDSSQLMLGTYIGLLIKTDKIYNKSRLIFFSVISGFVLLVSSFLLSLFVYLSSDTSLATSILSLTPGGMDQMAIIASAIHANLSIVAGYQLFRLFFIFFVVPPILKPIIKKLVLKKAFSNK